MAATRASALGTRRACVPLSTRAPKTSGIHKSSGLHESCGLPATHSAKLFTRTFALMCGGLGHQGQWLEAELWDATEGVGLRLRER